MDDELFVVETERAHPARVYNAALGGKDNYVADREAAAKLAAVMPDIPRMARANRDWMLRATRFLVRRGVVQFLDIGSGIPASPNLHQIAQEIDPQVQVIYVDNDPVVGAHWRALHTSTGQGRTEFVFADVTDPAAVLAAPELARNLALARPVALMMASVLMYFDDDTVHDMIKTLIGALPTGSYLAISHPTADFAPDTVAAAVKVAQAEGLTYISRTYAEVEKLFDGLELCLPGVVAMPAWWPSLREVRAINPYALASSTHYWVGVAVKS
jgi:hypothetical protein